MHGFQAATPVTRSWRSPARSVLFMPAFSRSFGADLNCRTIIHQLRADVHLDCFHQRHVDQAEEEYVPDRPAIRTARPAGMPVSTSGGFFSVRTPAAAASVGVRRAGRRGAKIGDGRARRVGLRGRNDGFGMARGDKQKNRNGKAEVGHLRSLLSGIPVGDRIVGGIATV